MTTTDGVLVILPNSRNTPESVALLSALTIFDPYLIGCKLRSALPQVMGGCSLNQMEAELGEHLRSAGIRFLAIADDLFQKPFNGMLITECRFDPPETQAPATTSCKGAMAFLSQLAPPIAMSSREPLLMLLAEYSTVARQSAAEFKQMKKRGRQDAAKNRLPLVNALQNMDSGFRRVIFLYRKIDPVPLLLIENEMDYRFLGPDKEVTAVVNFGKLIRLLEGTFGREIQTIPTAHFFGGQSLDAPEPGPVRKIDLDGERWSPPRVQSNKDTVHAMVRLIYWQWLWENNWIAPVMR
jgi:hypothetical protein